MVVAVAVASAAAAAAAAPSVIRSLMSLQHLLFPLTAYSRERSALSLGNGVETAAGWAAATAAPSALKLSYPSLPPTHQPKATKPWSPGAAAAAGAAPSGVLV